MPEAVHAPIVSKIVKAGGRVYFIDLRESKKGTKYLQVTESRRQQNGENVRNSLILFPDHVQEFQTVLSEVIEQM